MTSEEPANPSDKAEEEITVLCEANAQAFILADDPAGGWKNMETFFAMLTHIKSVKDGLRVEIFGKNGDNPKEPGKRVATYKWNPSRVKSKDDSRYLVLLVKPWDKCEPGDKYLTMTLKFHTDAGAMTWSSISEQMVEKLTGLKKAAPAEEEKQPEKNVEEEEDPAKKEASIEAGTYTIVSSKVDWVSFWSHLNENQAHRTLLPVNSVVEVTNVSGKDSRGKKRIQCKVLHLYYPQFSELADDEVPDNGAVGYIKGNYLARREANLEIVSADTRVDPEWASGKFPAEVTMMESAFKEIEKLTGLDRALALRAIRVTLQHVIINPYRPRRLKKNNAKHANIFLHECGPDLLAVVGFEVEGNKELFLNSAAANTDMAKLILQNIATITSRDLKQGKFEQEKGPAPVAAAVARPSAANLGFDPEKPVKLNVGGQNYQTMGKNLLLCTNIDWSKQTKDDSGAFFIDRDAPMFEKVLKYLRTKRLPNNVPNSELEDLALEAHFFGINDLCWAIKNQQDIMATQVPNKDFLEDHFLKEE